MERTKPPLAQLDTLYSRVGKRWLDLLVAGAGLVLTAPLQAVIALGVARTMGRPVLFKQVRPGLHGQPFTILKFRTMTDETAADGSTLPDEFRLTPFGEFLRSSSLDELPQLWNIVRGEMSLVGPRPFLMRYLPLYSEEQSHRHDVRPGVTGWAAVTGRNDQSWAQKLESDVWYTRNVSLRLDLKILWRTLVVAVRREGVSREGHVTGEEFTGA